MAGRIRSIKPELLDDEKTRDLSDPAWRLFVSSWLIADDHGNLRGDARFLAATVWQDTTRTAGVAALLVELAAAGLITRYQVNGASYFAVNGWRKHQRIDNAAKPRVPGLEAADSVDSAKVSESLGEPLRTSESRDTSQPSDRSKHEEAKNAGLGEPPRTSEDLRSRVCPRASSPLGIGEGVNNTHTQSAGAHGSERASVPGSSTREPVSSVLAALRSHPELASVANAALAEQIGGAMLASGKPIAWIVQAIADVARDAGATAASGSPYAPAPLARLVARYCANARRPRDTDCGPVAGGRNDEEPAGILYERPERLPPPPPPTGHVWVPKVHLPRLAPKNGEPVAEAGGDHDQA